MLRRLRIYRNTASVNGMFRRCVQRKTPMIIQLDNSQVPPSLRGPVLVDSKGLPRYWASVWSTATAGALADSTHLKKLRYLDSLYQHADELCGYGGLDDALASLDDATLGQILESWFISIRNKPRTSTADETRWQVGFNFVTSNLFRQAHLLTKPRKICLWRLNLRVTGCIFDGVRKGWVFYFSQIDDEALSQLHHLDKTLNVLARRFGLQLEASETKSFVRVFHEAKRGNEAQVYIPNFDTTSLAYKRDLLEMYGMDHVAIMTEVQIDRAFRRKIRRETSELEEDIQGGSRG